MTKLNASGCALVFSTYLGGNDTDRGKGVAVDASGDVYVTGNTASPNFPTMGAFQMTNGGGTDAFVTKLNARFRAYSSPHTSAAVGMNKVSRLL